MRTAKLLGIMLMGGMKVHAGEPERETVCPVMVYLENEQIANKRIVFRAQAMMSSMFAEIGVPLRWGLPPGGGESKSPALRNPGLNILLRLAPKSDENTHRGALAYASPYARSGVRVTVFYDRVPPVLANEDAVTALLAYTLAHEITHVLQGVARHSDEGLMKAHWTLEDQAQMKQAQLPFSPYDVELIRSRLAGCQELSK